MKAKTLFFIFISYFSPFNALISFNQDEIIKLDVGGKKFYTYRSTLTRYPKRSMLSVMFDKDSPFKEPLKTEEGCFFLDDNPKYFDHILEFLRYGFIPAEMTDQLKAVALKLCHPMYEEWEALHKELLIKPSQKRLGEKGPKLYWNLVQKSTGLVVARNYGVATKEYAQLFLDEYRDREINKDLCFFNACSCECRSCGSVGIFNIEHDRQIGVKLPFKIYNLSKNINPLKEAVRIDDANYFVCSGNGRRGFAIFNAITGEIIESGHEYEDIGECIEALKEYVEKNFPAK